MPSNLSIRLSAENAALKQDLAEAKRQLKQYGRQVQRSNRRAQRSFNKTAQVVRNAIGVGIGNILAQAAAVSQAALRQLSDSLVDMQSTMRNATRETGAYEKAWSGVVRIAVSTGTALQDQVALFQNLKIALGELNATTPEILRFQKGVTLAGKIGGAGPQELSNSLRQLGQGLAGGVLRAEEFNSIIENTPYLAQEMAKGLGASVGQLRQMVLKGEVFAGDILPAILSRVEGLEKTWGQMDMSIGTGLQSAGAGLIALIDSWGAATPFGSTGNFFGELGRVYANAARLHREGNVLNRAQARLGEWFGFDEWAASARAAEAATRAAFEAATAPVGNEGVAAARQAAADAQNAAEAERLRAEFLEKSRTAAERLRDEYRQMKEVFERTNGIDAAEAGALARMQERIAEATAREKRDGEAIADLAQERRRIIERTQPPAMRLADEIERVKEAFAGMEMPDHVAAWLDEQTRRLAEMRAEAEALSGAAMPRGSQSLSGAADAARAKLADLPAGADRRDVRVLQQVARGKKNFGRISRGRLRGMGIPGFAAGGVAPAGMLAMTGERGREMILPAAPVRIIPHDRTERILSGAGGTTIVNQTLELHFDATLESVDARIMQAAPELAAAAEQGILESIARGGGVRRAMQG